MKAEDQRRTLIRNLLRRSRTRGNGKSSARRRLELLGIDWKEETKRTEGLEEHSQGDDVARGLWVAAKARAAKLGREFRISERDISVPEFCPILGIRLEVSKGRRTGASPSLDRIDPSLGYVRGNVAGQR